MLPDKEEINTFFVLQTAVACFQRVHIPPYHSCTKFENILRIICRDVPNFANFILVYARL